MTTDTVVTNGLVLKATPYKEKDALLQVYTLEYGKITLLARGLYNPKSKNIAACQTLTLAQFTCILRKGISPIIKATPVQFYRHCKEDIEAEIFASFIMEYMTKMIDENKPDQSVYNTCIGAINQLEQGIQPRLIYLLFMAYILQSNGCSLVVDACSQCYSEGAVVGVSFVGGGFVCSNCISSKDHRYDKELLQSFRYINKCPIESANKLVIKEEYYRPLSKIMEQFIDDYIGVLFQTRKFIKQMI